MKNPMPTSLIVDGQMRLYFDISPLLDENWTGIPAVAAGLARAALKATQGRVSFFFEEHVIANPAVEDALARRSGLYLMRDVREGHARRSHIDPFGEPGRISVAIHPSVKLIRRVFDLECNIIHDLSTLTTPQFHTAENIDHHMGNIIADIDSNVTTFCVSQATCDDLRDYLGIDPARLCVVFNGVEWPADFEIRFRNEVGTSTIEPFILILGTREPRKNIRLVFDLLRHRPELLQTHRFVFVGQIGWLAHQQLVPDALTPFIESGRIRFTGFLNEYHKYKLLRAAETTIYPSYLEGFGLPVAESLSAGTPCVTTFSSSMPEIGGDLCWYHDPFSIDSLHQALQAVQRAQPKQSAAYQAECRTAVQAMTWDAMFAGMLHRLDPSIRTTLATLE